tara:strand:- start:278 stop:544 length:267 start_codon:yes stop_codon:yes gene_type:complete
MVKTLATEDRQDRTPMSIEEMRAAVTAWRKSLLEITNGERSRITVFAAKNLDLVDALCIRFGKNTKIVDITDELLDEAYAEFAKESMN